MCELVEHPLIMTGWACCHCPDGKTYNGLWRDVCKWCGAPHCEIKQGSEIIGPRKE